MRLDAEEILRDLNEARAKFQGNTNFLTQWEDLPMAISLICSAFNAKIYHATLIDLIDRLELSELRSMVEHLMIELQRREREQGTGTSDQRSDVRDRAAETASSDR